MPLVPSTIYLWQLRAL
jgi:hypothetical protein